MWHFFIVEQGFTVIAVMIARVRPSLNVTREAVKWWDEVRVTWPRLQVPLDFFFLDLSVLFSFLSFNFIPLTVYYAHCLVSRFAFYGLHLKERRVVSKKTNSFTFSVQR